MEKRLVYWLTITLLVLVLGLPACGGGSSSQTGSSGAVQAGQNLFASNCTTCHGPAGKGIPGLGKDMTSSEFIASQSDSDLIQFIKQGRTPADPLNTTGVAMPPYGGNPSLSEADLSNIVAYIRSIHK